MMVAVIEIPPALWVEVVEGSCLVSIPFPLLGGEGALPLTPPHGHVPRQNTPVVDQSFALYRSFTPQRLIFNEF